MYCKHICKLFCIVARPIITYITPTTIVTQSEDFSVELECFATGNPLPSIMWEFNGESYYERTSEEHKDAVSSKILIKNITLSQRGNYTCCATNGEGTQKATVELIVNGKKTVA